jgi:cellulose biosynthesis protein BcsQ
VDADVKGSQGSRYLRRREEFAKSHPDVAPLPFIPISSTEHLRHLVEEARAAGDDLVIDMNPSASDIFAVALSICDIAIHPVRLGHTEMDAFPPLLDILDMVQAIRAKEHAPKLISRSLLTDYRPTKQGNLIKDKLFYSKTIDYKGEIPHSEKFGDAILQGLAVWELSPKHRHNGVVREVILGCIE